MTSKRLMLCAITLVSAFSMLSSGCGEGAPPCRTDCGLIEGTYALQLSQGTLSPDCQALAVTAPEGPLTITRQGAALEGTLQGVEPRGTLYQGNEFNLSGTGTGSEVGGADGGTAGGADGGTLDSVRLSLNGRYSGPNRSADGGTPTDGGAAGLLSGSFSGTWTGTASTGGTRRCTVVRSFTGTRQ